VRQHTAFAGLGLLAVVALTFPLVFHLREQLPGSELVGAYSHVWKYWWTHEALLVLGINPAHCPLVNYPEGLEVGYYTASFGNGIWTLPVTRWLGPVASFNVVVLGSTAAACWAMSVLGMRLGLPPWAAAFAGLAWALAPHHLGYVMGGAIEHLATPWIPLFLLATAELLRPSSQPTAGAAASAGLALGVGACLWLTAMTAWFTGALLGLFGGWVVLVATIVSRGRATRGAAWAIAGIVVGCLATMLTAKLLLPTPVGAEAHGLVFRPARLALLLPISGADAVGGSVPSGRLDWLNHQVPLTVALLALAGFATRTGRLAWFVALPFLVDLALPEAWFRGRPWPAQVEPSALWTLGHMLASSPERRLAFLHLPLAIASGAGLIGIAGLVRRRVGERWTTWVIALAAATWTLELVLTGPVALPVPRFEARSAPHAAILQGSGQGALVDFPLMIEPGTGDGEDPRIKAWRSRYVYEQTRHGRPILGCVGSRLAYGPDSLPVESPFLLALEEAAFGRRPFPSAHPGELETLGRAGFRWLAVHGRAIPDARREDVQQSLRAVLGAPVFSDSDVTLYELPTPG